MPKVAMYLVTSCTMDAFPKIPENETHIPPYGYRSYPTHLPLLYDAGAAWLKQQDSYSLVLDAPWLIHLPKVFPW